MKVFFFFFSFYLFQKIELVILFCLSRFAHNKLILLNLCQEKPWTIIDPWHGISNNIAYTPSENSDLPTHQHILSKTSATHLKKAWLPIGHEAMTPISLHICAGWSESLLGAHAHRVVNAVPQLIYNSMPSCYIGLYKIVMADCSLT